MASYSTRKETSHSPMEKLKTVELKKLYLHALVLYESVEIVTTYSDRYGAVKKIPT
jgi:hypothetical protein